MICMRAGTATGARMIPLINRELSMLAFNERVLAQCELPWVPALERLRYLTKDLCTTETPEQASSPIGEKAYEGAYSCNRALAAQS